MGNICHNYILNQSMSVIAVYVWAWGLFTLTRPLSRTPKDRKDCRMQELNLYMHLRNQCLDRLATKALYYRSYNYDVMILQTSNITDFLTVMVQ